MEIIVPQGHSWHFGHASTYPEFREAADVQMAFGKVKIGTQSLDVRVAVARWKEGSEHDGVAHVHPFSCIADFSPAPGDPSNGEPGPVRGFAEEDDRDSTARRAMERMEGGLNELIAQYRR